MKKIGVIINPNAKKIRKGKISIDDFRKISPDIVDIRLTNDLKEIDRVVKDFKKKKMKYIGITGGDGTIHQVISRMIAIYGPRSLPPVIILKGGTMDNIGRSIGLKGNGKKILKRLADKLSRDEEPEILSYDTMKIGKAYCFLFGFGFVTNFLEEAYRGEKGFIKNMMVIRKAITHAFREPATGSLYEGVEADIKVDGKTLGFTKITGLLAGTVKSVAEGANPLFLANKKPGTFHLLASGMKPLQVLFKFYFVFGIRVRHRFLFNDTASSLKIRSRGKFRYTMDGDLYDSTGRLDVGVGIKVKLVKV